MSYREGLRTPFDLSKKFSGSPWQPKHTPVVGLGPWLGGLRGPFANLAPRYPRLASPATWAGCASGAWVRKGGPRMA